MNKLPNSLNIGKKKFFLQKVLGNDVGMTSSHKNNLKSNSTIVINNSCQNI